MVKGSSSAYECPRVVGEGHEFRPLMAQHIYLLCFSQDQITVPEIQELQDKGVWKSCQGPLGSRPSMRPLHHKEIRERDEREDGVFRECCRVGPFCSFQQPYDVKIIPRVTVLSVFCLCLQGLNLHLQCAE